MKAVIQRVNSASVSADGKVAAAVGKGLVVYFCVERDDPERLCDVFARKVGNLRIFSDDDGKMNLSALQVGGEVLLVSQFTLAANLSSGNRPDFFGAERSERAQRLYLLAADRLRQLGLSVGCGVFGADMTVEQSNDGPVTVIWEAR